MNSCTSHYGDTDYLNCTTYMHILWTQGCEEVREMQHDYVKGRILCIINIRIAMRFIYLCIFHSDYDGNLGVSFL